jgi:hypothetical protein
MLRCVALVTTDVPEESMTSIITVTKITLMIEVIHSYEMSFITRVAQRNIQEDGILHSHRRERPQILHSNNLLGSVAET